MTSAVGMSRENNRNVTQVENRLGKDFMYNKIIKLFYVTSRHKIRD